MADGIRIPIELYYQSNFEQVGSKLRQQAEAVQRSIASSVARDDGTPLKSRPGDATRAAGDQLSRFHASETGRIESQLSGAERSRALQQLNDVVKHLRDALTKTIRDVYNSPKSQVLPHGVRTDSNAYQKTLGAAMVAGQQETLREYRDRGVANAANPFAQGDPVVKLKGVQEALDRLEGLLIGVNQHLYQLSDIPVMEAQIQMRAMLDSLQKYQRLLERAASDRLVAGRLNDDPQFRQAFLDRQRAKGALDLSRSNALLEGFSPEDWADRGEALGAGEDVRNRGQLAKLQQQSASLIESTQSLAAARMVASQRLDVHTSLVQALSDEMTKSRVEIARNRAAYKANTAWVMADQLENDPGARAAFLDSRRAEQRVKLARARAWHEGASPADIDVAGETERLAREDRARRNAASRSGGPSQAELDSAAATSRDAMATRAHTAAVEAASAEAVAWSAASGTSRDALKRQANALRWQQGMADGSLTEGSTWFQRTQQRMAMRSGRAPQHATDYQTLRGLMTSRMMTTASFGLSGGLMYGGMALMRNIINESTQLQQEMIPVEKMFDRIGKTADGLTIAGFRQEIRDISVDVGVAADEATKLARQLGGVFSLESPPGSNVVLPDMDRALLETRTASKFAEMKGLSASDITNELTAVSLAYGQIDEDGRKLPLAFEPILDMLIEMEEQFGSTSAELLQTMSKLAPIGDELGFSLEQMAGVTSVLSRASAQSADVIADRMERVLPGMRSEVDEIVAILSTNTATAGRAVDVKIAAESNQIAEYLRILMELRAQGDLSDTQQDRIVEKLGGSRQAGILLTAFSRPQEMLRSLNEGVGDGAGNLDDSWARWSTSIEQSMDKAIAAINAFGNKIVEAGIGDILVDGADALRIFAQAAGVMVDAVGALNDMSDGWIGKLALGTAAVWGLSKAMNALAATQAGAAAAGMFSSAGAAMGVGGQRYSPLRPMPGASAWHAPMAPMMGSSATAASKMFGGRFAGAVAAGGFRSAALSGLAGMAPGAAAVLSLQAISMAQSTGEAMAQGRDQVAEKIREKLAAGVPVHEIRQAMEEAGAFDETGVVQTFFDRLVGGGSQAEQMAKVFEDEVSRHQSERFAQYAEGAVGFFEKASAEQLEALDAEIADLLTSGELTAGQRDALVKALGNGYGSGPRVGRNTFEPEVNVSAKTFDDLAAAIRADPTNAALQSVALKLAERTASATGNDAAWLDLMSAIGISEQDALETKDLIDEIVAAQDAEPEFELKLNSLVLARELGTGTFEAVRALIQREIDGWRSRLEQLQEAFEKGAVSEAAVLEVEAKLAELEALLSDNVTFQPLTTALDFRASIMEAGGTEVSGTEAAVEIAIEKMRAANSQAGVSMLERGQAAMDVIAARRDQFLKEIEDIEDDGEYARALAAGFTVPDEVRSTAAEAMLTEAEFAPVIAEIADALKVNAEEARRIVLEGFMSGKRLNEQLALVMLRAKRAQIEAARDAAIEAGANMRVLENYSDQLEENSAAIEAAERVVEMLNSILPDKFVPEGRNGGSGSGSDSDAERQRRAWEDYHNLILKNDPVAQARHAVQIAQARVARANPEDRAAALGELFNAQQQLQQSMLDAMQAQNEVAIAMAESIGDTVGVARLQVDQARQRLAAAQSMGVRGAELDRAKADLIRAQTNQETTEREDRMMDLEYLYEFDKITAEQFIKMLQVELARIPETNKRLRYDIERRIKAVRDEIGGSLSSFNLPEVDMDGILYSVRRLREGNNGRWPMATPQGLTNYATPSAPSADNRTFNDNRRIEVTVNESGDTGKTLKAVSQALDAAPRSGIGATGEWI